jgi:hypothetical protein
MVWLVMAGEFGYGHGWQGREPGRAGGGVQLIEQTGFGVRSAVLVLEKPGSAARFVLVPMLHLGTPGFYRAVRRRLQDCEVVVVEGVGGRTVSVITLAYRIAGRVRRSGLVDQSRGLELAGLQARIVRPDLTAAQFARGWRKIAAGCAGLLARPSSDCGC